MTLVIKRSASLLILLLLTSCALLKPSFDTPTVTIKSFRVLPATQVGPQFEIELHIINPNRSALEFVGVSYTVSIEEYPLLSGVSNQLPVIEAYSEGDVIVTASPDIMEGLSLMADLVRVRRNTVNYDVQVKLDVGAFFPIIYVEKTGEISLMSSSQW